MIAKLLVRTAVAAGVVAGAAHLIKKHNLVEKTGVLAEAGVAKVQVGILRGVTYVDELLTRFADDPTPTTDAGPPVDEDRGTGRVRGGDVSDDAWARATRVVHGDDAS